MAHHCDRPDRRPRQVRLLGAQCQRRPGYQRYEQRTDWNYEYNAKLAQTAENNGFEYALSQVRYEASYGAVIAIFWPDCRATGAVIAILALPWLRNQLLTPSPPSRWNAVHHGRPARIEAGAVSVGGS